MRSRYLKTLLFPLIYAAFINGCAPVISEKTLTSVDRAIGFEDLVKKGGKHTGKTVLLGGRILRVENLEDITVIEVLEEILSSRLKPSGPEASRGRFLAEFSGFKDPAVFYPGALITVAGVLKRFEKRILGKAELTYPVLSPVEHHLWSEGYDEGPRIGFGFGISITGD